VRPMKVADRHLLYAVAALWLAVLATYWPAIDNGFHLDDGDSITENPAVRIARLDMTALAAAWHGATLERRPLPSVTFAVDWWRGTGSPRPFQFTNVILHGLNATLVFALIYVVLGRVTHVGRTRGRLLAALAATALWALHPIQVQAVTYLVQRMTELATLFVLAATLCYLRARRDGGLRRGWLAAGLCCFALGVLCKETAWVTPLLWLLAEYGLCRDGRPLVERPLDRLLLALPLLLAAYPVADVLVGGPFSDLFRAGYVNRDFTLEERLLTQPRVLLFHLGQLLWPVPGSLSIEHDFVVSRGLLEPPWTLVALLAVVGWSAGGYWLLLATRWRVTGFLVCWLPATLAIESTLVPLEMVFEHRIYLPSVGLAGLLALAAERVMRRGGRPAYAAVAVLLVAGSAFAVLTTARLADWRDDITLYEAAAGHAPGSARLWGNLAVRYYYAGRPEDARRAAQRSMALDPEQGSALEAAAVLALDDGRLELAEALFERAIARRGARHALLNYLGEIAIERGRSNAALERFEAARARAPWVAEYFWNTALTLEVLGRCREAWRRWQEYRLVERDDGELARLARHLRREYEEPAGRCRGAR